MDEIEFNRLASQGYNRIPLISEAFADLETPLSLYLKLCAADAGGKLRYTLASDRSAIRRSFCCRLSDFKGTRSDV